MLLDERELSLPLLITQLCNEIYLFHSKFVFFISYCRFPCFHFKCCEHKEIILALTLCRGDRVVNHSASAIIQTRWTASHSVQRPISRDGPLINIGGRLTVIVLCKHGNFGGGGGVKDLISSI